MSDAPDDLRAAFNAAVRHADGAETVRRILCKRLEYGRAQVVHTMRDLQGTREADVKVVRRVYDLLTRVRAEAGLGTIRVGEAAVNNAHMAALALSWHVERAVKLTLMRLLPEDRWPKFHADCLGAAYLDLMTEHYDEVCRDFSGEGMPDGGVLRAEAEREMLLAAHARAAASTIQFGADYRSCRWGEARFSFTATQAAAVAALAEARDNGTPDLGEETVLQRSGSAMKGKTARLRDLFKSGVNIHPAWTIMIVPGESKGTFRLADPPA
jgi:hypothetical protein